MFQGAILTSGTEMGSWAVSDPENNQDIQFLRPVENLGCNRTTIEAMMDCMREIPAPSLFLNSMIPCPVNNILIASLNSFCLVIIQSE